MIETFKTFEKFYLSQKSFPEVINFSKESFESMMQLYSQAVCFPLTQRDADGRRVVVTRMSLLNPDEFPAHDVFRLMAFVVLVLLEEEETQIAGFSFISDISNITARHVFTPTFAMRLVSLMSKGLPIRFKDIFYVDMPAVAKFLVDLFASKAKEKMNSRFVIIDSKELKDHIDLKILPKEYGGVETSQEMMESFRNVMEEKKEKIIEYSKVSINWSKVPERDLISNETEGGNGSFRKLDID